MPPKSDTNKSKQTVAKPNTSKGGKESDKASVFKMMDLDDGWLYHSKK